MILRQAQSYASQIIAWLTPYCVICEIAGSVRREKNNCNDIDLVIIPKTETTFDLLGVKVADTNHCAQFLLAYCAAGKAKHISGTEPGVNLIVGLTKCQLDCFFATRETWGTILLHRTGSAQHNIWIAQRAKQFGYHWSTQQGLIKSSDTPPIAATEKQIYDALKLPWIPPASRELDYLTRKFGPV